MNKPYPPSVLQLKYPYPTFTVSSKEDTFVAIVLSLSDSQRDNSEGFDLSGMLKFLENEKEVKRWPFQMSTNPTESTGMQICIFSSIFTVMR